MMISVIIPVYNAQKYISQAIEDVLKQDHEDFELILVDDASTDASASVCDDYAAKDARIRVIHAHHGGAAAARNRGIDAAKGEYICFIDSDDTVEADYLSYMYDAVVRFDADLVCCGHDEPAEDGSVPAAAESGEEEFRECGLEDLLYQRGLMSVPWGYLYKKSLWEDVRFPEGTEAEDMGTIYRLFMKAERSVKGDKVCYHYIQRSSSTIYTTASSRRKAYYRHSRKMLHEIRTERPGAQLAAINRHFSCCAQDLSETPLKDKEAFVKRLYSDLEKMAPMVRWDKKARLINRAAAFILFLGPKLLHCMLRLYYRIKIWRMKA
ncbi:MAG: glycosyltransferase [Lachnospiraceae bacterium]|nr:glycosyltransferase [Lachnospiraceae bacterium]